MTVLAMFVVTTLAAPVATGQTTPAVDVPRPDPQVRLAREAAPPPPPRSSIWHALAVCESGMNGVPRWNANTGNGFHGGLQFHPNTWKAVGGHDYAPRADLATPAQQIAAAERLLAKPWGGWHHWPVCSRRVGLR